MRSSVVGVGDLTMNGSAVTVLVVDDAPDMRFLARAVLESAGLTVVSEAADGPEALERVRALDPPPVPTVILLDNMMPGLTGLEVAERVLADTPEQLIVLFSAYLSDEVKAQADRLGVTACVSKVDVSKLGDIIRELVDERSS
jgi:CheY-like chemotaxis protein